MADEDDLVLGGNIVLSGFREVDGGTMIILKKMIGNYARKFSDKTPGFEKLHVHLKQIHASDSPGKFEINAKVNHSGKTSVAEDVNHNIFVAVDNCLKGMENSLK